MPPASQAVATAKLLTRSAERPERHSLAQLLIHPVISELYLSSKIEPTYGSGALGSALSVSYGGQANRACEVNFAPTIARRGLLLLAIFGFQIYRAYAKTKGIPLLLDDATAAQLMQLLQQLRQPNHSSPWCVPKQHA